MAVEATPSLSQLNPRQQSATVILAQQAARNAVKRQIQRQGRVKLSMVSNGEITRLAMHTSQSTGSFMRKLRLRQSCKT